MGIELMDWQKQVACGTENSLAVPAGIRSGKNVAVAHAMKERRTLVLEPSRLTKRQLMREARYYGVTFPEIDFYDDNFSIEYIDFSPYEQVIIQEMSLPTSFEYDKKLEFILDLREEFKGRIVVIGTPYDLPDPIFTPLIHKYNWPYIQVKSMLPEKDLQSMAKVLSIPRYITQIEARFVL